MNLNFWTWPDAIGEKEAELIRILGCTDGCHDLPDQDYWPQGHVGPVGYFDEDMKRLYGAGVRSILFVGHGEAGPERSADILISKRRRAVNAGIMPRVNIRRELQPADFWGAASISQLEDAVKTRDLVRAAFSSMVFEGPTIGSVHAPGMTEKQQLEGFGAMFGRIYANRPACALLKELVSGPSDRPAQNFYPMADFDRAWDLIRSFWVMLTGKTPVLHEWNCKLMPGDETANTRAVAKRIAARGIKAHYFKSADSTTEWEGIIAGKSDGSPPTWRLDPVKLV